MSDAPIEELKALAHPARFAIIAALAVQELNVGEIERVTSIRQPALSQQLAVLRDAGLVDTRRDAKLVYYSLVQEAKDRMRQALEPLFCPAEPGLDDMYRSGRASAVFARVVSSSPPIHR